MSNTISLDFDTINSFDMSELSQTIIEKQFADYFTAAAGVEHYRLLAYLSTCYTNVSILDVGTYKGCSALALSYNDVNTITSFDVYDYRKLRSTPENVSFVIGDVVSGNYDELILTSPLIMLDTDHDGSFEIVFYDHLCNLNYKGLLLLDDIHLNEPMKKFWNLIKQPKQDITSVGHWSGTGVVVFE